MLGLLDLLGWPPSLLDSGILFVIAMLWGTQARRKIRPYLLAIQVGVVVTIVTALLDAITSGQLLPSGILSLILSQTLGQFTGFAIMGWLIIRICFIIRFRNDQSNIFTRNRRK